MQPVPNMPFKFKRKSMVLKVQQGECGSSMISQRLVKTFNSFY